MSSDNPTWDKSEEEAMKQKYKTYRIEQKKGSHVA